MTIFGKSNTQNRDNGLLVMEKILERYDEQEKLEVRSRVRALLLKVPYSNTVAAFENIAHNLDKALMGVSKTSKTSAQYKFGGL